MPAKLFAVSSFDDRRLARANWPVRRTTLDDEPLTDERIPRDVDARLAMVAELTRTQWSLSGADLPRYSRHEMPGRVLRPR